MLGEYWSCPSIRLGRWKIWNFICSFTIWTSLGTASFPLGRWSGLNVKSQRPKWNEKRSRTSTTDQISCWRACASWDLVQPSLVFSFLFAKDYENQRRRAGRPKVEISTSGTAHRHSESDLSVAVRYIVFRFPDAAGFQIFEQKLMKPSVASGRRIKIPIWLEEVVLRFHRSFSCTKDRVLGFSFFFITGITPAKRHLFLLSLFPLHFPSHKRKGNAQRKGKEREGSKRWPMLMITSAELFLYEISFASAVIGIVIIRPSGVWKFNRAQAPHRPGKSFSFSFVFWKWMAENGFPKVD